MLLQSTANSWLGQRPSCSPSPEGGAWVAPVHKEVTAIITVFRSYSSSEMPKAGMWHEKMTLGQEQELHRGILFKAKEPIAG